MSTCVCHYADVCVPLCRCVCATVPMCVGHYADVCVCVCVCATMPTRVCQYASFLPYIPMSVPPQAQTARITKPTKRRPAMCRVPVDAVYNDPAFVRVRIGATVSVNGTRWKLPANEQFTGKIVRKKTFRCRASGKRVHGYEVKWDADGVKEGISIPELAEMVV